MIRRSIAGSLIMLGVMALNIGALTWWIDREVLDADRLSEVASTVVRTPEFRDAVAADIKTALVDTAEQQAGLSSKELAELSPIDLEHIDDAIARILDNQAIITDLQQSFVTSYRALTEANPGSVSIDLSSIRNAVSDVLRGVDPSLAERVEVSADQGDDTLTVDTSEYPDLRNIVDKVRWAWMLQLGFGAGAIAAALLIHPRRFVALRRVGVLLAIGAGLQLLVAWGLMELATSQLDDEGFTVGIILALEIFMDSLRIQAYLQLGLAAVIAVAGQALQITKRVALGAVPRLA